MWVPMRRSSIDDKGLRPSAPGRRPGNADGLAQTARAVRTLGLLLTLLPALAVGGEFQTPAITAEALSAGRGTPEELLIVDVRPNGEYKSGHVAGAINIPYTQIDKHLDQLSQAKNGVVLYCTFGERTREAEQILLDHAIPNVFHLEGGLGAWRQGGHEIHTGWGP
jgi:rhodanese-related sulfurtransferase